MTKRRNKIIILLVVLVVVIAAVIGFSTYEAKQEEIAASDEIILTLDTGTVTALSWEYVEGESSTEDDEDEDETDEEEEEIGVLSFSKVDGTWVYDEDDAFPVNEDMIESLLSYFAEFGVSFVIENVDDYSQYGLDDPVCTINITTEDTTYEITLGTFSTLDEERYISIGDGNVYLTSSDPYDTYAVTIKDMIENDSALTYYAVYGLEFSGTYEYSVYYEAYEEGSTLTYDEDDVFFTEIDGTVIALDTSSVSSYITALTSSGLELTDYVTYSATDDDIAACGLDDPELSVTVSYTVLNDDEEEEEQTFTLLVSRDPEEAAAAAEAAEEETEEESDDEDEDEEEEEETITAYAMIEGSDIIYQITADEYTTLMAASYNDLRHAEVISVDVTEMTAIYATVDGKTYEFTSETDEDGNQTWYYNGEETDITDISDALADVAAEEFTDDEADGTLELALVICLDDENFPQVSIELYRHDSSTCLAVVNDSSLSYVSRSSVVDLAEAVNAIVLG